MIHSFNTRQDQSTLPKLDNNHINVFEITNIINNAHTQLQVLIHTVENEITYSKHWQYIRQLESILASVADAWCVIDYLQSIAQREDQKENYQVAIAEITQWNTQIAQHDGLYRWIKAIAHHPDFTSLDDIQKRLINHWLLHFRLAGADLAEAEKREYENLQLQLARDSTTFESNLVDSSCEKSVLVQDEAMLTGLPNGVIQTALQAANTQSKAGWLFELNGPNFQVVMQNAEDERLREQFYTAWVTRASESTVFDNSQLMYKILYERHQLSQLTQFNNYAERSLAEDKVAENSQAVLHFLNTLIKEAMPQAHHELKELQIFAEGQGHAKLRVWDLSFFAEKLSQAKFGLEQQKLRAYFPVPHVLKELAKLLYEQFELHFDEVPAGDVWHPEVKRFAIRNKQQVILGYLYVDLYARSSKRSGAWVHPYTQRRLDENNQLHLPTAFLTCNFEAPLPSEVALLTHDDVVTLFHEMGHALHHVVTQVDYATFSGMAGVAWDVVEFPSQLLEQFPWMPTVLKRLAKHYQTGEPLSDATIDALYQSRCFHAGLQLARQLEFSLFDFRLHLEFDPKRGAEQVQMALDTVREKTCILPVPSFNRFQHSFSHIFGGGYAAGYYSYLWAEIWAADAFQRFVEEGVAQGNCNANVGSDFINSVLAWGGSVDMLVLFKKFRGRNPDPQSFLIQRGIAHAKTGESHAS